MAIDKIRNCLGNLKFTSHAKNGMLKEELGEITESDIREALVQGEVIESDVEAQPYPSFLVYGETSQKRPLHVVCAPIVEETTLVIITVYEPDPTKWIKFRRRI